MGDRRMLGSRPHFPHDRLAHLGELGMVQVRRQLPQDVVGEGVQAREGPRARSGIAEREGVENGVGLAVIGSRCHLPEVGHERIGRRLVRRLEGEIEEMDLRGQVGRVESERAGERLPLVLGGGERLVGQVVVGFPEQVPGGGVVRIAPARALRQLGRVLLPIGKGQRDVQQIRLARGEPVREPLGGRIRLAHGCRLVAPRPAIRFPQPNVCQRERRVGAHRILVRRYRAREIASSRELLASEERLEGRERRGGQARQVDAQAGPLLLLEDHFQHLDREPVDEPEDAVRRALDLRVPECVTALEVVHLGG